MVWKEYAFWNQTHQIRIDIPLAVQSQANGLASLRFSFLLSKMG